MSLIFECLLFSNVYGISFGSGYQKELIVGPAADIYDQPTEYKSINCNGSTNEMCLDNNIKSKIFTNHELCVIKNNTCEPTNILSKYKLVFKTTPGELLVDNKKLDNIENIYDFIGVKDYYLLSLQNS